MIDISNLNKADVLATLYNASRVGSIHYDSAQMTREEAQRLLALGSYFDYLKGRVMKIDLSSNSLDPWGYDRDNGSGAAWRAIRSLKKTDES